MLHLCMFRVTADKIYYFENSGGPMDQANPLISDVVQILKNNRSSGRTRIIYLLKKSNILN